MISFPLFCLFFFTRISAENLCLTWLFLSTELLPTELSLVFGVPSSSQNCFTWQLLPEQGAVKCMIHTRSQSSHKNAHGERIPTWSSREQRGLFGRAGFVPVGFEVLQTQRIKEPAAVLEQLLAQQNTVQGFVLLVHFGINKRPSEIKTTEGEKGGD